MDIHIDDNIAAVAIGVGHRASRARVRYRRADGEFVDTQNLNLQIQRLEADVGTQLVHRAPHRYAPMTLTRRGRRLIEDLNRPDIKELLDRYADANARPKGDGSTGERNPTSSTLPTHDTRSHLDGDGTPVRGVHK